MNTRNYTKDDFVRKAKSVHGNKYDYSKVVYKNTKEKVCIICPKHGEFWQTPKLHIKGGGCKECAKDTIKKKNSLTQDDVIKRFIEKHGDKYDYSKVVYENMFKKVCIICHKHGEFWQTPQAHLRYDGCGKCSNTFMDKEYFIEKSNKIHDYKYDYSKIGEYGKNTDKVKIVCPVHGEFEQRICEHLNGNGCQKCGIESRAKKRRCNTESLILRFKETHGDYYDYSKVSDNYVNRMTRVPIICPKHGEFMQTPENHLVFGCPSCSQSVGEREIDKILISKDIKFTKQKSFDWLRYIRKQKLDFYLDDFNIAIEFQGEQHYRPISFGNYGKLSAIQQFNELRKRDDNKKQLCESHGVKLYYILYNDDIEKRLNEILNDAKYYKID